MITPRRSSSFRMHSKFVQPAITTPRKGANITKRRPSAPEPMRAPSCRAPTPTPTAALTAAQYAVPISAFVMGLETDLSAVVILLGLEKDIATYRESITILLE